MSEGVVGPGIDTRYPQIDTDGTVHVSEYLSVAADLESLKFLDHTYTADKEYDND